MKSELKREFSIKTENLGPGPEYVQEVKFLNRTIRWLETGMEIEGDEKHSQILVKEWCLENAKECTTPGVKANKPDEKAGENEIVPMTPEEATKFRRGVARIVYLAQDRVDMAFCSKELAKKMARPSVGDEVALKRAIRYLKSKPRALYEYPWQDLPGHHLSS